MTTGCYPCDRETEFSTLPPRERIAFDEHWRLVHATGTNLPGWLVLVSRRHVVELAELTDAEAASLGRWQVTVARALTAELGTPKTYVAEFGEAPGFHLHFHLIARPLDLADTMRGPGIFSHHLGRPDDESLGTAERDELSRRVTARLTR